MIREAASTSEQITRGTHLTAVYPALFHCSNAPSIGNAFFFMSKLFHVEASKKTGGSPNILKEDVSTPMMTLRSPCQYLCMSLRQGEIPRAGFCISMRRRIQNGHILPYS